MKIGIIVGLLVGLAYVAGIATASVRSSSVHREAAKRSSEVAQLLEVESRKIAISAQGDADHMRAMAAFYDGMADNLENALKDKDLETQFIYAAQLGHFRGAAAGFREAAKGRDEMATLATQTVVTPSDAAKH